MPAARMMLTALVLLSIAARAAQEQWMVTSANVNGAVVADMRGDFGQLAVSVRSDEDGPGLVALSTWTVVAEQEEVFGLVRVLVGKRESPDAASVWLRGLPTDVLADSVFVSGATSPLADMREQWPWFEHSAGLSLHDHASSQPSSLHPYTCHHAIRSPISVWWCFCSARLFLRMSTESLVVVKKPIGDLIDDAALPFDTEMVRLPSQPVPASAPFQLTASMRELMAGRNDTIERLMDAVQYDSLIEFLECLTGEDGACSDIVSRQSASVGLQLASDLVMDKMTSFGFAVSTLDYHATYAPNIIARLASDVEGPALVMGAHLDSRNHANSDSTGRAPGANDDGSGSAILLEMARIISELDIHFGVPLEFHFYTGEEQGLLGSGAVARAYADEGVELLAMLQTDMVAFTDPEGDGTPELGLPTRFTSPELRAVVEDVIGQFLPQVKLGGTSVCCSDQQSFFQAGYNAIMFFDDGSGRILDPMYHNVGDLVRRDGFGSVAGGQQYGVVAQAVIACLGVIGEASL